MAEQTGVNVGMVMATLTVFPLPFSSLSIILSKWVGERGWWKEDGGGYLIKLYTDRSYQLDQPFYLSLPPFPSSPSPWSVH